MSPKRSGRGGAKKTAKVKVGRPSKSSAESSMKMTMCTAPTMVHRTTTNSTNVATAAAIKEQRLGRKSGKRVQMSRNYAGKVRSMARRNLDHPCENSNDSGLGFDHHTAEANIAHAMSVKERLGWPEERPKRQRAEVKVEHDEVNENYTFPERSSLAYGNNMLIRAPPVSSVPSLPNSNSLPASSNRTVPRCISLANRSTPITPVTLTTQLAPSSRYMDISLTILCQPEQQHRARYQTEGSRGAVKDRSGNGFPIVQLTGYNKPATLQVFIGTDLGKVAPHMFYQACRVSGKNSTPCGEKKLDGTIVIELQLEPGKDMVATCDCVGILKERNVDVEHRFPDQVTGSSTSVSASARTKKKSTRCRMVFRTFITLEDGSEETLQVCSQPIVCTQPPGIPEISKKSLTSCPASGGLELFILGKNFLKDTQVYFQLDDEDHHVRWEKSVVPDKEFLQQTHLVCVVPPFMHPDTTEPVTVRLYVVSSGKTSEAHQFVYTPVNGSMPSVRSDLSGNNNTNAAAAAGAAPFLQKILWPSSTATSTHQSPTNITQQDQDIGMMPPPGTSLVPLSQRRPSATMTLNDSNSHSPPMRTLKQELLDDNSQHSLVDCGEQRNNNQQSQPTQQLRRFRHFSESSMDVQQGDSNMSMLNENSMDVMRHNNNHLMSMMNDNSNHSLVNENSMDMMMVRRNSFSSRSYCESSMDVHTTNSNLSPIHDENSCHSNPIYAQSSLVTSSGILSSAQHNSDLSNASVDDLKVMDLRTKIMPTQQQMATVADLVNTIAPSMATLQSFGVTESTTMPLQAQSVQSIENYLTNLDKSDKMTSTGMLFGQKMSAQPQQIMNMAPMLSTVAPINETTFMTSQQSIELNEVMNSVVKSESAANAEMSRIQTNSIMSSATTGVAVATSIESAILPTAITTERLDALVNCAVDTHIHNLQQPQNNNVKDLLIGGKMIMSAKSNGAMTSQDVMLSGQLLDSPNMAPSNGAVPANDMILNTQISPSLMCRNSTDPLLNGTSMMLTPPIPITSQLSLAVNEPEKAIIFNAAADFLETQKQLNELDANKEQQMLTHQHQQLMNGLLTTAVTGNTNTLSSQLTSSVGNSTAVTNGFAQYSTAQLHIATKSMDSGKSANFAAAQQSMKEMTTAELNKKNEDRMIPPAFATLSENELINIINPSCFDQV